MEIKLKRFEKTLLSSATQIWNEVVDEGNSFPGDKTLSEYEAHELFMSQTITTCAVIEEEAAGIYILHPNNIVRCSHIANSSYAVGKKHRGKGIGKALVIDSLEKAKENDFCGLQFNAVVANNYNAIELYLSLGFSIIGTIKNGFRLKDGSFIDTLIFFLSFKCELVNKKKKLLY